MVRNKAHSGGNSTSRPPHMKLWSKKDLSQIVEEENDKNKEMGSSEKIQNLQLEANMKVEVVLETLKDI